MSIDLKNLVDTGGTTLDDLVSPVNTADMPINNERTANDLAAHAALLTEPEMAVDNYTSMMREFSTNEGSPTMDKIIYQANARENELSIGQMTDILGDETIPMDRKVGYASLWRTGFVEPQRERSVQELVGINQLEKEGVITDDEEVDDTRWDMAGKLAEVNEYNNNIQKMINEADIAEGGSGFDKMLDIAELLLAPSQTSESLRVLGVQQKLRNELGEGTDANGRATAMIQSLFQLGESKEEIRARVAQVPLEKRGELAQAVYDMVIESNKSLTGKNQIQLMNNLREYLVEGEYTTGDRIVDDITSVLDAVGLGMTARTVKEIIRGPAAAARVMARSPASVGETVGRTNTKSANELIKMAADDNTGEVAKRIYNTSREDAINSVVGPEVGMSDDAVRMKPLIDDDQFDPDVRAIEQITDPHGSIQFTESEKASKLKQVTSDFNTFDKTGLVNHKEMTSIKAVDAGVNVRTIIGPAEGGFSDPAEAVRQVKYATRKYGVSDEEITLLKLNNEGNYIPVKNAELEYAKDQAAGRKGNYVVGINHTSPYDPVDTISWSVTDVKGSFLGIPLNIFDNLPMYFKGKSGSITQHLIPSSSYISPTLTRSASVTADQTANSMNLLINTANEWAAKYKGLDGVGRSKLDNYILKANHESLKFNPEKLRAEGWTEKELDAFRGWKKTQDTLFVLENTDMVRQSRRKGFGMFVTGDGQDSFLVKPIANSTLSNMQGFKGKAYDPELGLIRTITSEERKALYKEGGTLAKARYPVSVGEDSIGFVIVKQNPNSYIRTLRDTDQLLNYRDGHFTIYYNNPVFITTVAKNADGSEYEKAIATSGTVSEAKEYIARLQKANPKAKYDFRADRVGDELEEYMWQSRVNAGRTSQRTRGEMLKDVTDRPTDPNFRHIMSPEESLIRSINSISRRINYKEWTDVAKQRFMKQYKDFLPIDPNTHVPVWPDDVTKLRDPGISGDRKAFTDAISTYRYIDTQENGFINLLDDAAKNFFKRMAETSGDKGWNKFEKVMRAGEDVSPTALARKQVFRLTLAANPLRQIVVQASQSIPVIVASNPTFLAKLVPQMTLTSALDRGVDISTYIDALGSKLTGLKLAEAKELAEAYKKSGIASAVSAHSLIRDDLKSLVNRGVVQQVGAVAGKPLDVMQKVGFEAGENMLMRSVWLSEYDKARKAKKAPLNAAELSMVGARVRDLTLNMNKAGELAYNENALSVIMQFAQAPHKGLAQIMLGNRALSTSDRIKLGTAYLTLYGTGYGLLYEMASKLLPADDRELHDLVSGGLFQAALNRTLSTLYGEPVNTDFSSSMRLAEIPNVTKMFENMATMDLESIMTSSPAIGLVYGDNARLGNLMKSMYRFFTVPEDDGAMKDVGVNFLNMFSGASNFFKARYAMQRGYSITTKGEVSDSQVNEVEAMMKVMGFQTVDEMLGYATNEKLYKDSGKLRDDVKSLLDETTRRLGREGISELETEYVIRMYQEANRVFKNNPEYQQIVQQEIGRRIKSGDGIILDRLIGNIPIYSDSEFMDRLSTAPIDEEAKRELIKIYNFMKEPE